MSVRWNWNEKKGYYVVKLWGDIERKVNIYCGNCLGVEIYEFKDKDNGDMYELYGFWNDTQHLDNILNLNGKYDYNTYDREDYKMLEIHLYTKYSGWGKIARRFAKAKIKVVLEYEESKESE
jgi:hypothetical protein